MSTSLRRSNLLPNIENVLLSELFPNRLVKNDILLAFLAALITLRFVFPLESLEGPFPLLDWELPSIILDFFALTQIAFEKILLRIKRLFLPVG